MLNRNQFKATQENEEHVRVWFELLGFDWERLDTRDGKKGRNADWKFTRHQQVIICEVKTIFSGGQAWLTQDQYERHRIEAKRQFDRHKSELSEGNQLIVTSEYYNYVHGITPKPEWSNPPTEDAHKVFLEILREELENDPEINQIPFSVTISIDGLYVPPGYKTTGVANTEFYQWLKSFLLAAQEEIPNGLWYANRSFEFPTADHAKDDSKWRGVEAFVQIATLIPGSSLLVQFIHGGTNYNERGIAGEIEKAISQIEASIEKNNLVNPTQVIALWWHSTNPSFGMQLLFDHIGSQVGEIPQRYYLYDWAFAEYHNLAAIILFEPQSSEPSEDQSKLVPFGYIITNPFLPQSEDSLRTAITKNCVFIKGIDADPLA